MFVSGEVFSGFRVLGFDLETTGFDMRKERIVEYALVGSDIDGSHINLQSLVNPGKRIPVDPTNVHGIKNSDVKNSGEFSQHISNISKMMEVAIIVGLNVI